MKTIKMFIAMLMISASTVVMAQPQTRQHQQPNPEQCQEMMWKKVSEKLMLSDAQNAKVKPIYLAYVQELQELCPMHKADKQPQADAQPQAPKEKTEADVKADMKQKFANERKRIDIEEKYFDKFAKELNARQAQYLVKSANKMGKGKGKPGKMFGRGMRGGQQGMQHGMMFGGAKTHGMQHGGNFPGNAKQHMRGPGQRGTDKDNQKPATESTQK